jgi:hypothetical protein
VENIQPGTIVGIFPSSPTPGALGVFTKFENVHEIKQLEQERALLRWEVRAYISDHVPLAGTASEISTRPYHNLLQVKPSENPLWIYLHADGRNAVYYGLFNNAEGKLDYITVTVESRLPSNAILLARGPINTLLDVFARNFSLPLVIHRLDLMSPTSGEVLLSESLISQTTRIEVGPMGGIFQQTWFSPYEALYREGLVTSSPFYKLICGWKMYEGYDRLRGKVRRECEKKNIHAKPPAAPAITEQELRDFGFSPDFTVGIASAKDLFEKLRKTRDAISHFLIKTDQGESHVYLADGAQLRHYSSCGAAMLYYSHKALEELRIFCSKNGIGMMSRGSILPMIHNRHQFIVKASDHGCE